MVSMIIKRSIYNCMTGRSSHKNDRVARPSQLLMDLICTISQGSNRNLASKIDGRRTPLGCHTENANLFSDEASEIRNAASSQSYHVPIMVQEVVKILNPTPGKRYIDMTFGAGGHSYALLDTCHEIEIVGLDRDLGALRLSHNFQDCSTSRNVTTLHGKFSDLLQLLSGSELSVHSTYDGVLIDAGFSSMQINNRKRGFALATNGPLDMRMDPKNDNTTAAHVLNRCEENHLRKIFRLYGEERYAKQIAQAIVEYRQMMGTITHTRQLQDIVAQVYREQGAKERRDKLGRIQHPATLVFQALRIFVNDELNQLYTGIQIAHRLLKPSCPCAIITFHSLEHLIVDQCFRLDELRLKQKLVTSDLETNPLRWRSDTLTRPSEEEVAMNPKSRASQLRTGYKLISPVGGKKFRKPSRSG